jgi:hypothetical protein
MDPTPLHPKVMTKLPDQAVYGPGVAGNVKRKTTIQVPPLQGSNFSPNGQRIIQIQLPKNGFLNGLNSYLAFTHQSPGPNAPALPAGSQAIAEKNALSTSGSNWIQRLRIKIGGKIVEDIDDYNVLHQIMSNAVVTSQFRDSIAGQLEGYESHNIIKMVEPLGPLNGTLPSFSGIATTAAQTPVIGSYSLTGVLVNSNRTGGTTQISAAEKLYPVEALHTLQSWAAGREYQIVLLSGLLRSAKYLPLRFMPPVEIELTLADFVRSHVWAPARDTTTVGSYYPRLAAGSVAVDPGLVADDPASITGVHTSLGWNDQPPVKKDLNDPLLSRHPRAGPGLTTETPSQNRTYEIRSVKFIAEILEFDDSFYQAFEASLSQGITIPYVTYTNHVYSLQDTQGDIQIAERVRSARSLLAVMRLNADLAHAPYPKFLFVRNGLASFQVKIGTQYFPLQEIDTTAATDPYSGQRLIELQKVISTMADVSHGMATHAADISTKFMIGMDLTREFDRLSGLDTTKGLPLFLTLKGQGGSPCQLNVFIGYDMFVDLFPGEVIEVLN